VYTNVDAEEARALRAEGLDPDDPAVRAGIDLVRWELSMLDELADHTIMLLAPDDPAEPIGLAVIEDGNIADPAYLIRLSADQAVQLGQALLRFGGHAEV
jgi:hypothetical protein